MPEYIISSKGLKLAYQFFSGDGPVVVFLPGYKSDMSGTKAAMLKSYCQGIGQSCLLLDYSGHGESEGEFIDGTVGQWTKDAVDVIQNVLGTRSVILVGSSMGGWIMLLSALKLGQQVAAMLGIAVAPDFTEELMWKKFTPQQQAELENKGLIYLPSDYDDPLPVTYQAILDGRENRLLHTQIKLACPARFIHGMRDLDVPWEVSLNTLNLLEADDVELKLLKDGDHRLSNESQLFLIRQQLADLIAKVAPAA